ncbi:family 2 glycosyl transferase [Candidatus Magnetomorum sp. HK-1]|nr:family 2 glycosyl transferase [Candidatus Magnetomorum sp. HK-1]
MVQRSFIIPVLDFSPHSPFSIQTLLKDLEKIPGEVICVFNNQEVFNKIHNHPRIDKFCLNSQNAGVSRSWNIGANLSEGKAGFFLNADLHITAKAIDSLEAYLFALEDALIVSPEGKRIDYERFKRQLDTEFDFPDDLILEQYSAKNIQKPVKTHDFMGAFFAVHMERFFFHRLFFDVRFSPCFMEEWNMGLQALKKGLFCYTVPIDGYAHQMGISLADGKKEVNYFGKIMSRDDILLKNARAFAQKWLK